MLAGSDTSTHDFVVATAVFRPFAGASGVRGAPYAELEKYTRLVIAHSVVWVFVMNQAARLGSVALYMSRENKGPAGTRFGRAVQRAGVQRPQRLGVGLMNAEECLLWWGKVLEGIRWAFIGKTRRKIRGRFVASSGFGQAMMISASNSDLFNGFHKDHGRRKPAPAGLFLDPWENGT